MLLLLQDTNTTTNESFTGILKQHYSLAFIFCVGQREMAAFLSQGSFSQGTRVYSSLKLNVDTQRLWSLLGWIWQVVCIIEGDKHYTVTDERSNLKAVYFCSLGWQQCETSSCTSVPKMGLPVCTIHKLVKERVAEGWAIVFTVQSILNQTTWTPEPIKC